MPDDSRDLRRTIRNRAVHGSDGLKSGSNHLCPKALIDYLDDMIQVNEIRGRAGTRSGPPSKSSWQFRRH